MAKKKLRRAAKQYGKLQVAPERAVVRSERRQAGRQRKREIRSNKSLQAALLQALSEAAQDTRRTPGLSKSDLAMTLAELAQRKVDSAAGTALARRGIESRFTEAQQESNAQLRELAARAGLASTDRFTDLMQAQADRKIQRQSLAVDKAGLALDKKKFRHDKYIADEELNIDKMKALADLQGGTQEIQKDIRQTFNGALSRLRSLTVGDNEKPVTASYVRENRGTIINGLADRETKGNRVIAKAVVERYLGESPSSAVERYMRRTRVNFWNRSLKHRPGPYVGAHPGLGG